MTIRALITDRLVKTGKFDAEGWGNVDDAFARVQLAAVLARGDTDWRRYGVGHCRCPNCAGRECAPVQFI